MTDKVWKVHERRLSKAFGTRRNSLSGSNSKAGTGSDTLHPDLYIEAKYRKRFAVIETFKNVQAKAAKENKIPILALHSKEYRGDYVLVRLADIKRIAENLKDESENNTSNNTNTPSTANNSNSSNQL